MLIGGAQGASTMPSSASAAFSSEVVASAVEPTAGSVALSAQAASAHAASLQATSLQATVPYATEAHATSAQAASLQATVDQAASDQATSDQATAFQALSARAAACQAWGSNVRVPPATAALTNLFRPAFGFGGLFRYQRAAAMFTSPTPSEPFAAIGSGVAVTMSAPFTWSGVQSGCCAISSAAAPATTGAANEVPLSCM